jgi:glutamate 5-kinase
MKGPKSLTIVIKLGTFILIQKICHARLKRNAGTSSIVDEKTHEPLIDILSLIVKTAVKLHKDGHKVIIVSSGAIGVGLRRMDLEKRPKYLPRIQVSNIQGSI